MKMRPASKPKASTQLEYISLACPGAMPTPLHSVVVLFVITHAKPLCLFFWTEASLTSEINPWARHIECIANVG